MADALDGARTGSGKTDCTPKLAVVIPAIGEITAGFKTTCWIAVGSGAIRLRGAALSPRCMKNPIARAQVIVPPTIDTNCFLDITPSETFWVAMNVTGKNGLHVAVLRSQLGVFKEYLAGFSPVAHGNA
jgi:hypothetical protein